MNRRAPNEIKVTLLGRGRPHQRRGQPHFFVRHRRLKISRGDPA